MRKSMKRQQILPFIRHRDITGGLSSPWTQPDTSSSTQPGHCLLTSLFKVLNILYVLLTQLVYLRSCIMHPAFTSLWLNFPLSVAKRTIYPHRNTVVNKVRKKPEGLVWIMDPNRKHQWRETSPYRRAHVTTLLWSVSKTRLRFNIWCHL